MKRHNKLDNLPCMPACLHAWLWIMLMTMFTALALHHPTHNNKYYVGEGEDEDKLISFLLLDFWMKC